MEIQYNYQIRTASDKRPWEEIEAIKKPDTCRVSAVLYGRKLARTFNAEIRMTEGGDHLNASATYITDNW